MKMVMKLITALAVTAILANSADAQTRRTKEVRIQPSNSLSRNSVSRNPVMLKHNCRFENGETDPDPRIRLQLLRDCREHENSEAE